MHISDIKAIVQSVESVPAGFGGLIMQRLWLSIAVGFAALVFGPQLLVGDEEVFALHLIGLGIGALPLRRLMSQRKVRRLKR